MFTLIIYEQFNFCRFRASAYTNVDRLSAVFTGRMPRRHLAGIKFTHRPKISFFAPQGRLVAPIHVKLGTADRHVGPLGCAKFHLNRCRGGIKKFHLKSHLTGPKCTLDRFENF